MLLITMISRSVEYDFEICGNMLITVEHDFEIGGNMMETTL